MQYVLLLGRILFSAIFILKSLDHFFGNAKDHAMRMEVPAASFAVPLFGLIALLGGLSVLFGYKARVGAWLIVIFLLPTTFMIHKFWLPMETYPAIMEHLCFMKNLSMMGSALMIAYFGSGPLSLDKR